NKQTSKASLTTGRQTTVRNSTEPPKWEVIPPTRGDCTTCTATSSNGAAIGITTSCPVAPTRICRQPKGRSIATAHLRACVVAALGAMTAGPVAPLSVCALSRNGVTTTLASESSPSGREPELGHDG